MSDQVKFIDTIEDLMNTSDEELEKEAKEDGVDLQKEAEHMRAVIASGVDFWVKNRPKDRS